MNKIMQLFITEKQSRLVFLDVHYVNVVDLRKFFLKKKSQKWFGLQKYVFVLSYNISVAQYYNPDQFW